MIFQEKENPREARVQFRFWLITFVVVCVLAWLLSGVLLPFVLGMAIAYFLDPLVSRMSRLNWPRWLSAFVVLFTFLAVIAGASILLYPVVREQLSELMDALPGYGDKLQSYVWPRITGVLQGLGMNAAKLQASFTQYSAEALGIAGKMVSSVVLTGLALLDIIMVLVLTPVVAFYLMRDWPHMVRHIDDLLPLKHAVAIRRELGNIDRMISGFLRGQAMVSLSLAVYYSIALSLAGLPYGIIIGLATGLLSFIPIVGTLSGIITSFAIGAVQFDSPGQFLGLAAVFGGAQVLEGYFLTPKLVGGSVGLHPVWIMFAVLAGGKLFGIVGIILGVPLLGTVAILLRLLLEQYRNSSLYNPALGKTDPPHPLAKP